MDNEMNVKQAQVKKRDKKKLALILLIPVIAIIILLMYSCSGVEDRTAWLSKKMEDASEKVVQLDKDIMITEPITINGSKTISGAGRIIYKPTSVVKTRLEAYKIPDEKCEAVKIADLSETQAMFEVSDGASLTIAGNVTIDGNQKGIDVRVAENGTLNVTESAVLKNGLGANVCSDGTIVVSGGSIQTVDGYNIMSNGAMSVEGGEIVGSGKRLMNIVSNGSLPKERLTVWLPYQNRFTSWFKGDFVTNELADLVKEYAALGIWLISEKEELDAAERLGAVIVETNGHLKPQ